MTSITSSVPFAKPSYRPLWLLAAVFLLPFIVGTGLYWSGWRPKSFVNHGELVQPRSLPESGLGHAGGRAFPTSELRGKWLLVLSVEGPCSAPCQDYLQRMQNVHQALNKERSRLQRVLISKHAADAAALRERFPELVVGLVQQDVQNRMNTKAWHDALNDMQMEIHIVDPLGKVMMRYADPGDMRGVLKDLERLLRFSWIRGQEG